MFLNKNISLYQVVRWILKNFNPLISVPLGPYDALLDRLTLVKKSVGINEFLLIIKSVRSNYINYLSGNPERDCKTRCTKDGLPVILGDLIPIIRGGSGKEIYIILTILYSTRALKTKANPNTDSITQPFNGDVTNLSMFMGSFWRDLGYRPNDSIPKTLRANLKTYRSKSGPNGHALLTCLSDYKALPESLIKSLEILGGLKFKYILSVALKSKYTLEFLKRFMTIKDDGEFRRLSFFSDKEGKTRIVGILDYYSQIALKPLHTYLANTLKKIPQDCTFDQAKFLKILKGSKTFYSVDLSNATDRFPISLIEILLKTQLPHPYVDAWKDVMVGYPFKFKTTYIKYAVGNPMGAYSSFNSFALTHHYIIYYCCKVLGKN